LNGDRTVLERLLAEVWRINIVTRFFCETGFMPAGRFREEIGSDAGDTRLEPAAIRWPVAEDEQ
jgi:hypothetical protein